MTLARSSAAPNSDVTIGADPNLVLFGAQSGFNPFTVIPDLTRHALTIMQHEPRVNSGLAICVYSPTVYPRKLILIAISNYNDFIIVITAFHTANYAKWRENN